jgi:hypothetical protein
LKKLPGMEELVDMDSLAGSKLGFIYAHEPHSVSSYFGALKKAMEDPVFSKMKVVVFFSHSKNDKSRDELAKIVDSEGYSLLEYDGSAEKFRKVNDNPKSNVTVVCDSSVPRKLFGQLFVLSDDMPSLISGQDNLANILLVSAEGRGRAFIPELLCFQHDVGYQFSKFIQDNPPMRMYYGFGGVEVERRSRHCR